MYLTPDEMPTARAALLDNEVWNRVRGFSVLADRLNTTRSMIDFEQALSPTENVPVSGDDYAVLYAALRRVGGRENEALALHLAARMLGSA